VEKVQSQAQDQLDAQDVGMTDVDVVVTMKKMIMWP
jgi:hypothetical protein